MFKKCKGCFKVAAHETCGSVSLLFLRLIAGIAFAIHGWGKMQNPMGWMGAEAPVPGIFQFLAAFSEFGGGIAWALGLLTGFFSLGIGFTMLVAVYTHLVVLGHPFINPTGGGSYELALVYLGVSVVFLMLGPGKFSIDAKLFGQR